VVVLTLLASLVGGFRLSLVAPHTHSRFDISVVVSAFSHLLIVRVRLIALLAACCVAHSPAMEATDTDSVLFAKRPDHGTRVLISGFHRARQGIGDVSVLAIYEQSRIPLHIKRPEPFGGGRYNIDIETVQTGCARG
jgi:hypothetical protein